MFFSNWMPCSECGASVERGHEVDHKCDPEKKVDYQIQVYGLRDKLRRFEADFQTYLESRAGRFELWLARRDLKDRH